MSIAKGPSNAKKYYLANKFNHCKVNVISGNAKGVI